MTNLNDNERWPDGSKQLPPDEPTQGVPSGVELTQVLPSGVELTQVLPSGVEPTQVLPTPAGPDVPPGPGGTGDWPAPQPAYWPGATPLPVGPQQYGPYGYGSYGPPPSTGPAPGHTPGYQAQDFGAGAYPPPGGSWNSTGSFPAPGQQLPGPGHAPHPGYYPPDQYYAPPATRRRRWPLALAAMLVALLMGGGTFLWAANQFIGAETSPTTTYPQAEQPQQPAGPQAEQDQRQEGTRTSTAVTAAQSAGIVLISAETSSGRAAGTGMVISAGGRVLTNYHVVAGSESVAVTIADTGDTYVATVVGFDQTRDVAMLQLKDASGLTTVQVDTSVPSVGAAVAAVGNAEGGGELVKAAGEVTDTDQDLTVSSDSPWGATEDLEGLIETSARAVPGDSGGPMFDADDEVIGITTAGSTKDGTSYAVPIQDALAVVDQIETGQDAGTVRVGPAGFLGIQVAEAESGLSGKTITGVVEGSPAEEAGVKAGSRLTKVGDTTIRSTTNLATVIRSLEPGQQVSIGWTGPNGNARQATVTLDSSPVN